MSGLHTAPATEYQFNKNGAMMQDYNAGITNIQYNVLNLPQQITFSEGHALHNTYDAMGNKRQTTHTTTQAGSSWIPYGNSELTTDYCGNIIYEDNYLKYILHAEGFTLRENGDYVTYYYLKDHLGNNRITLKNTGNGTEVAQVMNYYPSGMPFTENHAPEKQPYKFGGKELDGMFGLNWYDQGFRPFGATIPRTPTMDPLAEKYYNVSPYAQYGNNSVNRIDPDGRDWYWDKDKTRQYDPEITSQDQLQKGQTYIGATDAVKDKKGNVTEDYRADGSIMFSNESKGYARIWNNSIKTGKEEMGVILDKGVLVLPSYKNAERGIDLRDYDYSVKNGNVVDAEGTEYNTVATVHTHPNGGPPSTLDGGTYGDLGLASITPYKPVYVLQMQGKNSISFIVASPAKRVSEFNYKVIEITTMNPDANVTNLLKGRFSLRDNTMNNNFKKILGR
jgi:RHS repeat-associated protein